jgi:hypothetical protein
VIIPALLWLAITIPFDLAPGQSREITIQGPATATPRPTRTPEPEQTCNPHGQFPIPCPDQAFDCCARPLVPTPRPSASPKPTEVAALAGNPIREMFFCGSETQCARMETDVAWAVNCHVDIAFWERYKRPLAKRIAWHGYLNTSWMDPPELQMEAARQKGRDLWGCMEQRKRQILEQPPGAIAPPIPELVSLETGTFGWASSMWGTGGGFFRPDGTMKALSQWPQAIDAPHRALWKQWDEMVGGPITATPYFVPWPNALPEAWHAMARRNEPALFSAAPWKPYSPEIPDVAFPNSRALRVSLASAERWIRKYRRECIDLKLPCGSVGQLTNGTYRPLPGRGREWQDGMVAALPALLAKYGFEPAVQLELFDGTQARPAFNCPLWANLVRAGAKVSAFDMKKAVETHDLAVACAGGHG